MGTLLNNLDGGPETHPVRRLQVLGWVALVVILGTSALSRLWGHAQETALSEAARFVDRAASQRTVSERVLRLALDGERAARAPDANANGTALEPYLTTIQAFAARQPLALGDPDFGMSSQTVRGIQQASGRFVEAARDGDPDAIVNAHQAYVSAIDLAVEIVLDDVGTRTTHLQVVSATVVLLDLGLVVLVGAFVIRALGTTSRAIEEELEARRHVRQMMLMLQSISNRTELARTLGTHLERLLPGFSGTLHLFGPTRDTAEQVGAWGEIADSHDLSVSDCWGLRLGKTYGSNDGSHLACTHVAQGTRGWCLPMQAEGDALGIFHVHADAGSQMTDALRERASRLGEGLAVTLANLRLRETLKNQSIRDALTGIFNRRYMEESLKRELKRAGRRRYPLTVMMVDLDHFKRLNDTFGHAAGDDVLCAFAQFLTARCRADDTVCRYGGEEFVVIFPEMSIKDATIKAEALRSAWAHVTTYGTKASTTFSAGLATYPEDATSLEGLLGTVDAALYAAKSSGRDRIHRPAGGPGLPSQTTASEPTDGDQTPDTPALLEQAS